MEHFEKSMETFKKKWNMLRKIRGQKESGRALCEKPYRSRPPFARQSKQKKKDKK